MADEETVERLTKAGFKMRPEGAPHPMMVVYHGTSQMDGPGNSMLEVVLFKVWMPEDWSDPEWYLQEGSHMAGQTFEGEVRPILLTSIPLMVKGPGPEVFRGVQLPPGARPGKRPRGN
jgi:hypothetical protein